MPVFSVAQRLKIALGGFASFTGFVILVCAILSATGAANLELVFQNGFAVSIAVAVAALDVGCGVLLILRNKEILFSFASHQEKTSDNANQPNGNPEGNSRVGRT
jgi:hypothetical protein